MCAYLLALGAIRVVDGIVQVVELLVLDLRLGLDALEVLLLFLLIEDSAVDFRARNVVRGDAMAPPDDTPVVDHGDPDVLLHLDRVGDRQVAYVNYD